MSVDLELWPEPETCAWVEGQIGRFGVVSRFAHDHGYSRLWRIQTNAKFLWLKMHAYAPKWAGEVFALRSWASDLGLSPTVVAVREDPRTVILSERPGIAPETIDLDLSAKKRMWEAAGSWLRSLHRIENDWFGGVNLDGSPAGQKAFDPEAFVLAGYSRRIDEGEASGLLTSSEVAFVRFGIREWLGSVAGEKPRAVHRDFTPRNWMSERDGTLTGIIDFEHARWDLRATEMSRWWDWDFLRHPELIDVFFDAYGPLDERLKAQVRLMRMLMAANGVVWATGVNDLPFAQHNRDTLHRMIAEVGWKSS